MPHALPSFDPDFAAPGDWAEMYRALGLQVVPARSASEFKVWKRPVLETWQEFTQSLIPQATFERWYGRNGEHAGRMNMGLINGACSGNTFIVDLDVYKGPEAMEWWSGLLALHHHNGELETPRQTTGGGGKQMLFRAPGGWVPPTCTTHINVDIRGQGGFAVLAPSMHSSGKRYDWDEGLEPWEVEIAIAPKWLCDEIDRLVDEHGGGSRGSVERVHTPSVGGEINAFGLRVDRREEYMADMVWARVVGLWRECPIKPSPADLDAQMRDTFLVYERGVKSRIVEPGTPNHVLLEREGRGASLFAEKWRAAIRQWDGKVAEHGAQRPREAQPAAAPHAPADDDFAGVAPKTFELLDVPAIKALPDPSWLVKGLVTDNGLGFIYGPPGCGKSFIALGMALSVACKLPEWWGRTIERTGPVVYISSEGQSDLKFRIRAWEQATGQNADAAPFFLIRQSINFMVPDDVATLLRTIQVVADSAEAPCLVFVDTVSRVLPGADENLQKDMTLFISACDAVRQTFGSTVVGVHHTSRAGGAMRGSTVFDGAGDFLAQIEREEGAKVGTLTARKIKAAEDGWKQPFTLEQVAVGDIAGTTSLVAKACPTPAPDGDDGWPDKDTCRRIMAAIEAAWITGKPWSSYPHSKKHGRYAPVLMRDFNVKPQIAEKMIETWLMRDVLSVEVRNTDTKLKGLKVIGRID
jgi:hypothetical protein